MPVAPEIFCVLDRLIPDEFVQVLSSDLAEALGRDRFHDVDGVGPVQLEPKAERHLLPTGLPQAESILRVDMCTPYYGPGYERGFWPEIASTLEFLRHRVPDGRVWYGPDGTDQVNEVTSEFLDRTWDYWSQHGARPYDEKRRRACFSAGPNAAPAAQPSETVPPKTRAAYRHLLYAGLLAVRMHCQARRSPSRNPFVWFRQYQRSRLAGALADWLHNLAEFSALEFDGFDPRRFWEEHAFLCAAFPHERLERYREIFDAHLAGTQLVC